MSLPPYTELTFENAHLADLSPALCDGVGVCARVCVGMRVGVAAGLLHERISTSRVPESLPTLT